MSRAAAASLPRLAVAMALLLVAVPVAAADPIAVSPTEPARAELLAVSLTSSAQGAVAVSATGGATGGLVAASATGDAEGDIVGVSVTGANCVRHARRECASLTNATAGTAAAGPCEEIGNVHIQLGPKHVACEGSCSGALLVLTLAVGADADVCDRCERSVAIVNVAIGGSSSTCNGSTNTAQ